MRREATPDEHEAAKTSKPSGGERRDKVTPATHRYERDLRRATSDAPHAQSYAGAVNSDVKVSITWDGIHLDGTNQGDTVESLAESPEYGDLSAVWGGKGPRGKIEVYN